MKIFKKIGVIQLVLLAVSAIVSLRNLPMFAEMGFSIVFFLGIAALIFFIPITLVLAELSSTWPYSGGCYLWIKKAYGKSWALFVLWAYWMESIMWFPTVLIFVIVMLAHVLAPIVPNLENNNLFIILGIIIIFWSLTVMNFYGVNISTLFSSFGVIVGIVIPLSLIVIFGMMWFFFKKPINIVFSMKTLLPDFNFTNMVFFSVILLGLSGIELISFHIKNVINPKVNIVKALIISLFVILFIYITGALSIAIVVPQKDICLASGIIQALKIFFSDINMPFFVPILALLLFIGSIAGINTWIMGPPKGLLAAADDGILPFFLKHVNSKNVPVTLLFIQAAIGSIMSIVFFIYINSINGLIWIFICLSFQFAAFLYIMIFLSALKLRRLFPNVYRPFKVPFIKVVSCIGIISCLFAFLISYIQPDQIKTTDKLFYFLLLFISLIVSMLPASFFILINKIRKV